MPTRTVAEVGAILRRRREALHLTQDSLAGVSSSTIRKAENGQALPGQGLKRTAYAEALQWPSDALDRLEAGEDPTAMGEITAPSEPLPLGLSGRWVDLTDEQRDAVNRVIESMAAE